MRHDEIKFTSGAVILAALLLAATDTHARSETSDCATAQDEILHAQRYEVVAVAQVTKRKRLD